MSKPTYEELEKRIKELHKEVAEHKKYDDSLKNSEQTLDLLINTSPDIIYRLDPKGHVVFINKAISSLGYTPEELIGTSILDIVHPNDREQAKYRINERRCGDRSTKRYELRMINKDMLSVSFEDKSIEIKEPVYLVDAEGFYEDVTTGKKSFLGSLGFARDITGRVLAREAPRKSDEKDRDIFQTVNDGIVYATMTGKIIDVNDAFEKIIGISRNDIVGRYMPNIAKQILSLKMLNKVLPNLYSLIRGNDIKPFEIEYKDKFIDISFNYNSNSKRIIGMIRDITERKKAEEELINEKNISFTLVNALPFQIFVKNQKSEFILCNDLTVKRLKKLSGDKSLSSNTILGKTDHDFLPKQLADKLRNIEMEIMSTDKPQINEVAKNKDEGIYDLQTKIPIKDSNENVLGLVCLNNDISNIIKIEELLKESEKKYRDLFDNASDLIQSVGPNGEILYVNKAWRKTLGYTKEEISGITISDILHPDSKSHCIMVFKKVISGKKIDKIETAFITKKGRKIEVEGNANCLIKEGQPISTIGIFRDVTERKRGERITTALYEISRAVNVSLDLDTLYPLIHKSLSNIIDTTNFYIALYNKRTDTIKFAYYLDEEDSDPEILNAKNSNSLTAEVINSNKSLLITKKELIEKFRTGDLKQHGEIPEIWLGVPLLIKNEVIGVMCVQNYKNRYLYSEKDVKLLESVSEQIASAILHKKDEDEKKKLEEQFFQAQKMESIGRLAGGIAHDFNNVLSIINGYAELLEIESDKTSVKTQKALNRILASSKRATVLVKQLLDFAKGKKLYLEPVNINDVIKGSVKISETIFEKNIKVDFDFEDSINVIEADRNQIDQIFTNLLINAKDAMPCGGMINIKTENIYFDDNYTKNYSESKPGKYVKLSLQDNGMGMPQEIKDHIFEPFFTTKQKGTGLGLATSYSIVKNHNGFIRVYSELGQGTVFTIFFPVSGKILNLEKMKSELFKGTGRILFVDDEEGLREVMKIQLEELGYSVHLAKNGNEALEIFKKKKDEIDLVLLDMVMPEMSGKETFHELKKIKHDVKVLLISGFNQEEKANEILYDGALGFIQKPIELQKLSKVISDVFVSK